MAVFLFNPTKDNSIFSLNPNQNVGLDEQLVIGDNINTVIQFDPKLIDKVISGSTSYSASLDLFLSEANELTDDFSIVAKPIITDWSEGIGYFYQYPLAISGSTWHNSKTGVAWTTSGGDTGNISSSVTISSGDSLDINLNVTDFIKSGSYNNGFHISANGLGKSSTLLYFSRHTKSVYKPILSVKVEDSVQEYSGSVLTSGSFIISTGNAGDVITSKGSTRIDVYTRPRIIEKKFRTGEKPKYFLPVGSYYELKDVSATIPIIHGDPVYTRLSSDVNSNYFNLKTDNIPKHRYYELTIYIPTIDGIRKETLSNHIYIG